MSIKNTGIIITPCPFCGERDEVFRVNIDIRQPEGQMIAMVCGQCGCQAPPIYVDDPEKDEYRALHEWNKRYLGSLT
jgi:Lar family restriction alleviation protein